MNRQEVARYLALSEDTVSKFANSGELRGVLIENPVGAPTWDFHQADVDAFIELCRIQPGTVPTGRQWGADRSTPRCLYCGGPLRGICTSAQSPTGRHEAL